MSTICLFLVILGYGFANLLDDVAEEAANDDYDADYDTFKHLMEIGERLFGEPKPSSGESVSKWTTDSPVFPEELGDYAEGDILHPYPIARNGLRAKSMRWPNRTIPYEISPSIRGDSRQMIYDSIDEFHKHTCIKFKERKYDKDYVFFSNSNTGCWSAVGRIGGRQDINLQIPGCTTKKGTVMHEMLHAVGFLHEQNRSDRDKYVTINYNNIETGREPNFAKSNSEEIDNQGVGYDYKSVMHYSSYAFSRNGLATIEPKVRGNALGQREGFSRKDVQKVLKMYGCTKTGSNGAGFLSALSSLSPVLKRLM